MVVVVMVRSPCVWVAGYAWPVARCWATALSTLASRWSIAVSMQVSATARVCRLVAGLASISMRMRMAALSNSLAWVVVVVVVVMVHPNCNKPSKLSNRAGYDGRASDSNPRWGR